MPKFTLLYFNKQFPDDQACRKFLEQELWNNVPTAHTAGINKRFIGIKTANYLNVPIVKNSFR